MSAPGDGPSAAAGRQGGGWSGVNLNLDIEGDGWADIQAKLLKELERFAPGADWRISAEVYTDSVMTGEGEIVTVRYKARVDATMRSLP